MITNIKALGAMRRAYHERSRVLRVVFCTSNVYSSAVELEAVVTPFIMKNRAAALLEEVKGIFCVVFSCCV